MKPRKSFQHGMRQQEITRSELSALDQLMKSAAIGLSRRGFIKSTMAGIATALGIALFDVEDTSASVTCNDCYGPISNCYSSTGVCCDPNWQYCYVCTARCVQGCGRCGAFYAHERVCTNGAHGCTWHPFP
jgi:hypothetical protein